MSNKKLVKVSLSMLGLLLSVSSCATIVGKSRYNVTINSVPQGASVKVLNSRGMEIASGETPATFRLKASKGFFESASYTVHFSKEGYDDIQMPLEGVFNPWYLGNFVSWGLVGFIIDPITGKMWKMEDTELYAKLKARVQPVAVVTPKGEGQVVDVFALSDVPEEMRQSLVAVKEK